MHELSIATSILELARRHTPAGAKLLSVKVLAGPMRQIDPQAMHWAWHAAVAGTDAEGSRLELQLPPWKLLCSTCGREFESDDPFAPCPCGAAAVPKGGDELLLISLEVERIPADRLLSPVLGGEAG